MREVGGDKAKAAEILGVSKRTLYRWQRRPAGEAMSPGDVQDQGRTSGSKTSRLLRGEENPMKAHEDRQPAADARRFGETVVAYGRPVGESARRQLTSTALLAALRAAGTAHIYADTADREELGALLSTGDGVILGEVDGNTANQPLVHKVIGRYLEGGDPETWARELRRRRGTLGNEEVGVLIYAIVCGRMGNDIVRGLGAGRPWEVSLQLHMRLGKDPEAAKQVGRYLRRMVPSAFVKVPFTPHAPHCFLVARDLEREGIPVNFTSTFSARQAVVAALLADVTRTNIFMGRLNQGLEAKLLGEQVDLEAQRALRRLRGEAGIKTQLIVASMREWQTFVRVAGCDVFTAPCAVIRDFLRQTEVPAAEIPSQIETSYEGRLGIADHVTRALGPERIARLYRVEPELIEFLLAFRASPDYQRLGDGEQLYRRFEEAGFGDLFYAPTEAEWAALRQSKLPDLSAPLTRRVSLDTLYALLADADFERYQEEMDREIEKRVGCS